jgi:hypothetical protein
MAFSALPLRVVAVAGLSVYFAIHARYLRRERRPRGGKAWMRRKDSALG